MGDKKESSLEISLLAPYKVGLMVNLEATRTTLAITSNEEEAQPPEGGSLAEGKGRVLCNKLYYISATEFKGERKIHPATKNQKLARSASAQGFT